MGYAMCTVSKRVFPAFFHDVTDVFKKIKHISDDEKISSSKEMKTHVQMSGDIF